MTYRCIIEHSKYSLVQKKNIDIKLNDKFDFVLTSGLYHSYDNYNIIYEPREFKRYFATLENYRDSQLDKLI
jgi:hypothetical protein